MLKLDLSVRAGMLIIGQFYLGSSKVQIGCISSSDKIRADVFQYYGFRINTTDLEHPFLGYFSFCHNQNSTYLLFKIVCTQ